MANKLSFKEKRKANYKNRALERDSILFKWKSETVKLPFNPEFWVTINGSIGFLIKEQKWVIGTWKGILDEYGDQTTYVWHSLNTQDVQTGEAENHKDIIVCGNTPLYRPFEEERDFFSSMKSEADTSILAQLVLSRLNKAIIASSDQQKKAITKAYEELVAGYPLILTTSLMEELDTLELSDNKDIERMQYLNTFFQSLEKREANDFGIDLDLMDKRAQVSTAEIQQYDDVTTLEYLIMFEMRQRFMDEMKENGFDIEIVRNPIFFDEPTKEDVESGSFEKAEEPEEPENPEEEKPEEEGEKNDASTD